MLRSIFISYSSKDLAVAETIEQALLGEKFDVWRDQTRLETDWPREIALALSNAGLLLLVWSGHGAASKWVQHEWLTARALEKPILVCLLPQAPDLPVPLAHLHAVVFEDPATGTPRLLERVRNHAAARVRYDYTILPPNSYIPFNPNPDFRGRQSELLDLYLDLIGNLKKIGICQVGAVGMGGVGKTQLAVEFAYRFSYAFEHVFWMDATDPGKWMGVLLDFGRTHFDIVVSGEPGSRRVALLQLQSRLKHSTGSLLVFDNVGDPLSLNGDIPLESSGLTALTLGANLLFTSRRAVNLPGVKIARVDILEPRSALALLTEHRQPSADEEWKAARDICSSVGYLPLAIVLISAFLAARQDVSFAEYLAELERGLLNAIDLTGLSEEQLATRHVAAVEKTFLTQWNTLDNQDAKSVLRFASMLPESAIVSKARLMLLSGLEHGPSLVRDPVARAFAAITDLHLAEEMQNGSAIRLHPLIREALHRTIDDPALLKISAARRVKDAYADPRRLEMDCHKRGVGAVAADIRLALSWAGGDDFDQLRDLGRVLDHEADALSQYWPPSGYSSAFFHQQLHYRAATMGAAAIAQAFAAAGKGSPLLIKAGGIGSQSKAERLRLRGHANQVMGGRLLPGGRTALTSSWDSDLILWDLEAGEPVRRSSGHKKVVNCLATDASGKIAITGSDDCKLAVWDVESGTVMHYLTGHREYVLDVCLSDNGRIALSGERGVLIVAWDVKTGRRLAEAPAGAGLGFKGSIALSADGTWAVAPFGHDKFAGELLLWRVATGDVVCRYRLPEAIWGACFNEAADRLYLSGSDVVYACDPLSGTVLRTYQAPTNMELSLGVLKCRNGILAAGGSKGIVAFWNAESGLLIGAHKGHPLEINDVDLDASGQIGLTASSDRTAVVWDTSRGSGAQQSPHSDMVSAIAFLDASHQALSADYRGIAWWDTRRYTCVRQQPFLVKHVVSVEGVSSTGDRVLLRFANDEGRGLYETHSGHAIATFQGEFSDRIIETGLSPDGSLVLTSVARKRVALYDVNSQKTLRSVQLDTMVHSVAISPGNRVALLGCDYGKLLLIDLANLSVIASNNDDEESIIAVAVNDTSELAVVARHNATVEVRKLERLEVLARLAVGDRVHAVAVRGSTIALGDSRGNVHFFDLKT